jgi:hypothetical protein
MAAVRGRLQKLLQPFGKEEGGRFLGTRRWRSADCGVFSVIRPKQMRLLVFPRYLFHTRGASENKASSRGTLAAFTSDFRSA